MANRSEIEISRMAANMIRRDIIDMTYSLGNSGAHLGGSLSMAEILAVLYTQIIKFNIDDINDELRDRVILSKGHAAMALYSALVQGGMIPRDKLIEFKQNGSQLSAHPSLHGLPGIEYASGSLGQGLSLGVGTAIGLKRKNNETSNVYVLLGDGECQEGSIWEAAVSAANFKLNNIIAILDTNRLQYDGKISEIMDMSSWKDKWMSFGWDAIEVNGHNVEELIDSLRIKTSKPMVLIANTIKGKGISFMENNKSFHNARITREQYELAMNELEKAI